MISQLLDTESFRVILEDNLENCQNQVIIFSPFIKLNAIKWLTKRLTKGIKVRIITRLEISDIIQKVSDFEICQFAIDKGWDIGLIKNLHAKIYITDNKNILVGSNNLTLSGLGIDKDGNAELGVAFEPDMKSFDTIEKLLLKVSWIDQDKIDLMSKTLKNLEEKNYAGHDYISWPEQLYSSKSEFLLLSTNFPDISPEMHQKGKQSLFINDFANKEQTKQEFLNTEVYLWLKSILSTKEFTSFGWLTSKIHNGILDRPLPYRSKIKIYCENLFLWIEHYSDDIKIIKHNKTKSLELTN